MLLPSAQAAVTTMAMMAIIPNVLDIGNSGFSSGIGSAACTSATNPRDGTNGVMASISRVTGHPSGDDNVREDAPVGR